MTSDRPRPLIYILLGPTASGKSAVGLDVADRLGAEIISIDSMQVYRGMDIGTAKPSPEERSRVPHRLIDVRSPAESFSTAEYLALADEVVQDIAARGRKPLFIGGTALYIKSLLVGIFEGPSADWDFRRGLRAEADALGVEALHERLRSVDPEAAARIHRNDLRRIERALEIHAKTGLAPSTLRREWGRGVLRYDARMAGLDWPRQVLYKRIDARVDEMMAAGWLDEVKRLLAGPGLGREASQALGYKDLAEVVEGRLAIPDAVDLIKTRTRRFAKRQMTWFRSFPGVCWVRPSRAALSPEPSDIREMADKVMECFQ